MTNDSYIHIMVYLFGIPVATQVGLSRSKEVQCITSLVISQAQIVGCLWRILHSNRVTEPTLIATAIRSNLRLVPAQTTFKFNSTFKR